MKNKNLCRIKPFAAMISSRNPGKLTAVIGSRNLGKLTAVIGSRNPGKLTDVIDSQNPGILGSSGIRKKRAVLSGILGLCFLFVQGMFFSMPAQAQDWQRESASESFLMPDGTPIQGAIARGIDVSYWKKEIDWEQVAEEDVQFAMLGTRFRGEVDPYFPINAQKAREAGLEVGAYIYSYATTVEMAEQEADFVLDLIKDYEITYPVAFDAEDSDTLGTLPPSQVSEIINAFCSKIEAAGYYPMLYANEHWLRNKIDLSMLDYDIWVARYNAMYTYESPSMWQATNTGVINGVNGNVDIDFLFTDYALLIPANTWRTIAGSRYYYENHQMQKSTWIHDGIFWYYLNDAGNPETGWQKLDGNWYYLSTTGAMQTGWQQLNGNWYYLGTTGAMQTGWQQINGIWYYLAGGAMKTGWQQINGAWYYLDGSGAMQTGWQQINGAWYYLDGSGAMKTGWQQINGVWYYLDGSGAMQTGWQQINGAWYYLDGSGAMQTGWQQINGAWYYLDGSGVMLTGWQQIDGQTYYLDTISGQMLDLGTTETLVPEAPSQSAE